MNFMPLHYETMVILICLIILAYSLFGGIIADIWSDMWQMFILAIGMILTLIFIFTNFDFTNFLNSTIFNDGLNLNQLFTISNGGLINLATIVALGFGNILAIDFNTRIFSAKSSISAKKGCYFGGFLTLIIGLPFALLPIIFKFLNISIVEGSPVLLTFANNILPTFIAGILISGIISASLSTIDGAMLSMGNIVTQNLLRVQDHLDNTNNQESEKTFLYFSRFSLIPIACISMIFAMLLPSPGILLTVSFDIMFASLLAPFVFGFYLKKPNSSAAFYAILTGFIVRLLFGILSPNSFGIENNIFYLKNSFISADMDGIGTIIAPLFAFIVYYLIYIFSKQSDLKNI
jgi:Na+/proline symporter